MNRCIEIMTVGDEVVRGEVADNNAEYISRALTRSGLEPRRITALPDDVEILVSEFREAATRGGTFIVTGGLGPTVDDVTKEALIRALGCDTEFREDVVATIASRLRERGRDMPRGYRDQGRIPIGAEIMPNSVGLAVGLRIARKRFEMFLLPGVPAEMKPMFDEGVLPRLAAPGMDVKVRMRTFGLTETEVEDRLRRTLSRELLEETSLISSPRGVDVYLPTHAAGAEMIEAARRELGSYAIGVGGASMEEIVVGILIERRLGIATAESITGGLLASTIVSVPGASGTFREGFITYGNEAKVERLDVSRETLDAHGAVSAQVCAEMAMGARRRVRVDVALATTGIAGPAGAVPGKPVGLCYVGLDDSRALSVRELRLVGDRDTVRLRAVYHALDMLRLSLIGERERLEAFRFPGAPPQSGNTNRRKR
jgi:nicotinamide-nucleotide amidase